MEKLETKVIFEYSVQAEVGSEELVEKLNSMTEDEADALGVKIREAIDELAIKIIKDDFEDAVLIGGGVELYGVTGDFKDDCDCASCVARRSKAGLEN